MSYTIRGEASPTFTLSKRTLTGDVLQLEYQPTGGDATWTTTLEARNLQTGQTMHCTRTGSRALAPDLGGLLILENLNEDLEGDLFSRRFYAAGLAPAPDRCPGLDTWANVPWLQTDLEHSALRYWSDFKKGVLQGSVSFTQSSEDASHTTTSTWNLRTLPPAATR